jgi:hypothetical protein
MAVLLALIPLACSGAPGKTRDASPPPATTSRPPAAAAPTGGGVALSPAHGQPAAPLAGGGQSVSPPPGAVEQMAPAPGALSIADVWAQRKSLAGKTVVVRGKVVKFNGGILDRNWVHLQDGSGSAADRTNDLVVTTAATVKVGDIVTMSGVLAIGVDIGAGYAYDAILEKAVVK